jgi:hypothetical protein
MPIPEEWRPVVGWEGYYEVSSHGRVRSLDRDVYVKGSWYRAPQVRKKKGVVLSSSFDTFGYPMVKLKVIPAPGEEQRMQLIRVHNLVAEAFIGPRPEGWTIAHNDGNPANPWFTNLRYATMASNFDDKREHGTYTSGERHSRAKL